MKRNLSALVPDNRGSEELLRELPEGTTFKVTVVNPRNVKHHKKFFALLQAVYPHQKTYVTFESFHAAVKVALGHGETVIRLGS
jgi:hypothetical protein